MRKGLAIMGGLYMVAGLGHFVVPHAYERMMPAYLPEHRALVLVSGAAEFAGGLGVLVPQTRRAAAWGLVLLLVAVWPANLWMAQNPELTPGVPMWALSLRLPLQIPLMGWAFRYTRRSSH
jgi:uncharacterized membrane protein